MRLIATLLFASAIICNAAGISAGRWEGSIQVPERELKVIIDLAQEKTGGWVGSIIVPGLDIKGAPLAEIVVKDSEVTFGIRNALGGPRTGQAKPFTLGARTDIRSRLERPADDHTKSGR